MTVIDYGPSRQHGAMDAERHGTGAGISYDGHTAGELPHGWGRFESPNCCHVGQFCAGRGPCGVGLQTHHEQQAAGYFQDGRFCSGVLRDTDAGVLEVGHFAGRGIVHGGDSGPSLQSGLVVCARSGDILTTRSPWQDEVEEHVHLDHERSNRPHPASLFGLEPYEVEDGSVVESKHEYRKVRLSDRWTRLLTPPQTALLKAEFSDVLEQLVVLPPTESIVPPSAPPEPEDDEAKGVGVGEAINGRVEILRNEEFIQVPPGSGAVSGRPMVIEKDGFRYVRRKRAQERCGITALHPPRGAHLGGCSAVIPQRSQEQLQNHSPEFRSILADLQRLSAQQHVEGALKTKMRNLAPLLGLTEDGCSLLHALDVPKLKSLREVLDLKIFELDVVEIFVGIATGLQFLHEEARTMYGSLSSDTVALEIEFVGDGDHEGGGGRSAGDKESGDQLSWAILLAAGSRERDASSTPTTQQQGQQAKVGQLNAATEAQPQQRQSFSYAVDTNKAVSTVTVDHLVEHPSERTSAPRPGTRPRPAGPGEIEIAIADAAGREQNECSTTASAAQLLQTADEYVPNYDYEQHHSQAASRADLEQNPGLRPQNGAQTEARLQPPPPPSPPGLKLAPAADEQPDDSPLVLSTAVLPPPPPPPPPPPVQLQRTTTTAPAAASASTHAPSTHSPTRSSRSSSARNELQQQLSSTAAQSVNTAKTLMSSFFRKAQSKLEDEKLQAEAGRVLKATGSTMSRFVGESRSALTDIFLGPLDVGGSLEGEYRGEEESRADAEDDPARAVLGGGAVVLDENNEEADVCDTGGGEAGGEAEAEGETVETKQFQLYEGHHRSSQSHTLPTSRASNMDEIEDIDVDDIFADITLNLSPTPSAREVKKEEAGDDAALATPHSPTTSDVRTMRAGGDEGEALPDLLDLLDVGLEAEEEIRGGLEATSDTTAATELQLAAEATRALVPELVTCSERDREQVVDVEVDRGASFLHYEPLADGEEGGSAKEKDETLDCPLKPLFVATGGGDVLLDAEKQARTQEEPDGVAPVPEQESLVPPAADVEKVEVKLKFFSKDALPPGLKLVPKLTQPGFCWWLVPLPAGRGGTRDHEHQRLPAPASEQPAQQMLKRSGSDNNNYNEDVEEERFIETQAVRVVARAVRCENVMGKALRFSANTSLDVRYLPPEVFSEPHNKELVSRDSPELIDAWGLGLLLFEVLLGKRYEGTMWQVGNWRPFAGWSPLALAHRYGERSWLWAELEHVAAAGAGHDVVDEEIFSAVARTLHHYLKQNNAGAQLLDWLNSTSCPDGAAALSSRSRPLLMQVSPEDRVAAIEQGLSAFASGDEVDRKARTGLVLGSITLPFLLDNRPKMAAVLQQIESFYRSGLLVT